MSRGWLIVFAKAPRPGLVKTRMAPPLDLDQAAALYEAGRCFEEMHDPVQARQQYERVVQQHGDTEWAPLAQQRLEELSRVSLPGRSKP